MIGILKGIMCILVSMVVQTAATGAVQVTPEEASESFLQGLTSGENAVVLRYADNDYVNLIENAGDEETSAQLYESLFRNFSYEVIASASKGNVAVAKINIITDDFSKVMDDYQKDSYEYISANLYDKDISDKKKLSSKCLEIYLEDIDKAADGKDTVSTTIYLPMVSDGRNGWEVMVDDKLMSSIFGGLELPEEE